MMLCARTPTGQVVPYEKTPAEGRRFGVGYGPRFAVTARHLLSWQRPSLHGPEELPLPGVVFMAAGSGLTAHLPWGLLPVVRAMAGEHPSCQYAGSWAPDAWRPLDAGELSLRLGYRPNAELSQLAHAQPQGVIRTRTDASGLDAIAQIVEAYPDKRIAILVQTVCEAKAIRQGLRNRLTEAAQRKLSRPDRDPGLLGGPKVFIGLINDLAELQNWAPRDATGVGRRASDTPGRPVDLVLVWKAKAAALAQNEVALLSEPRAKMFGFAPSDAQDSPGEQLAVASLFGFHQVVIGERGQGPRPVAVQRLLIRAARLSKEVEELEILDAGIRKNSARNWQLVRAAKICSAEDLETLVVATDFRHAARLSSRLPGWRLLSAKAEVREAFQALSGRTACRIGASIPRAIVVQAELSHVEVGDYSALIHGGIDVLKPAVISRILFPGNRKANDGLLVVDCDDTQHARLVQFAQERRAQYRTLGWSVNESDVFCDWVEAFVAAQRARR